MVNYWDDLDLDCKMNKRKRFNYIMDRIKEVEDKIPSETTPASDDS